MAMKSETYILSRQEFGDLENTFTVFLVAVAAFFVQLLLSIYLGKARLFDSNMDPCTT